jgi:hypothetical protein
MAAKDGCPFSCIVNVADILLEIGRYLPVPNSSRYSDRNGATDRTPKIEYSDGDSHILMWYRSLYSDVGCRDNDSPTDTGKYLRADEDSRGWFGGREVYKGDTTGSSGMKTASRAADSQNPDTTSNDLQDLVSMGDSLDDTNDNRQTAHGDGNGIHEESVVSCLMISDSLETPGYDVHSNQ